MKSKTSQLLITAGIGLGCSIFVILISILFSGLITAWENKTLDYRFKLRGDIPTRPDIVLIDIDDASLQALGRWPWDRAYHGRMIDVLASSGAAAIGYDVLFDQPAGSEGDRALRSATADKKNLFYPVGFSLKNAPADPIRFADGESSQELLRKFTIPQQILTPKRILNVERAVTPFKGLLEVSEGAGHISSNRDSDGTVRRVPLAVNFGGSPFPAFGLAVTAAYLRVSPENISIQPGYRLLLKDATIPGKIGKGDIKIPIDGRGMMIINYAGRWEETFAHYSFIDIMRAAESEKGRNDLREGLKGKICLVSNTATGYDLKPVPVEENFPGGGIHANIVNTILTGNFLREISPAGNILILIILALGGAWLSAGVGAGRDWKWGLFSLFVLIAAYCILSYALFTRTGLITEIFSPSLGMILGFLTATLYGRTVEQRHSARLSVEMERLGRSIKSMGEELSEKEGELSNLREELSKRMSTFNTLMVRDGETIQKMALLEARMEDVLKEKNHLLQSKQQLEMRLDRILSGPVHSEYQLEGEWEALQKECEESGIITRSLKVLRIFEQAKRAAQSKDPVLILGESGTGKELIARTVHFNSLRKDKAFIAENCSTFSENLLESELFGHEKGAFTGAVVQKKGLFELADGGTFLLDEIGDTTPALQTKLLRVLQDGVFKRVGGTRFINVDVRIIAATNKELKKMVEKGTFREDLYYRLNVIPFELPPLRERIEDIEPLVRYFLGRYYAENGVRGSAIKGITPGALRRLKANVWKGNIRELKNVIARAVTMAKGKWITEADLGTMEGNYLIPGKDSDTVRETVITPPIPYPLEEEGRGEWELEGKGKYEGDADVSFLSLLEKMEFSIDKTARALGEGRGTVAHRLKGICFAHLVRSNGDIQKAALELSGGSPESLNKVRQRIEEYYGNLLGVIQRYENPEEAIAECRRRFKNLKGEYFTALEELVKKHFEKNRQI